MIIEQVLENGKLEIKPMGRLDSSTADEFHEAIMETVTDQVESLTINMSEVDFISSKGVRILVEAYMMMKEREMIITGANASVMEVLRLSGLLTKLQVNPEEEQ